MIITEGLCSLFSVGDITPVLDIRFTFNYENVHSAVLVSDICLSKLLSTIYHAQFNFHSSFIFQQLLASYQSRKYQTFSCFSLQLSFTAWSEDSQLNILHLQYFPVKSTLPLHPNECFCLFHEVTFFTFMLYSLLNPCKMLLSQFACYPSLLKLCTVTDQKLLGEENFVLQIFYSPLPCHDNLCKVLKYWLNWKANYRSKTIL